MAAHSSSVAQLQATESHLNRWWHVVGGVSMNLALGSLYGWSVFVAPLEKEFHWKRADTSNVFIIAVVVFALSFIVAGRLQDKLGPLRISLVGAVLVSLGFFSCAYADSLTKFFIFFGVLGGLGNGFGYATPIPVMSKWFPDKRGLAVGLAVGGYGAGSAIFGPLAASYLIPTFGWRTTFQVLGLIFFAMTVFGALLLKNPPAGYRPAIWTTAPAAKATVSTYEFTASEVLRTPTFYLMWIAYALGCAAGLMVISQLVPFAKSIGIPSTTLAAFGLVVGAVGNASGRILSGWISDHLGRINVLRLMIGISMVAMPILYYVGSNVLALFVMLFVVYWCYGTQLSVNAATAADFWGTKNVGINYGMLFTAWGVAGLLGGRIGGLLYDKYHNYQMAFYTAAGLAAVALVCESFAKRPAVPAATALEVKAPAVA
ncbi:MAG TPA: OFA family MFS transporter [Candidatus Aquilonibacter sp.]|nr:OFA family MFS transporter [Candidatus Aquilonibacter sp.]